MFKLLEARHRMSKGKRFFFFMMSVERHWKRLARELVDASSLEVFEVRLDGEETGLAERCSCPKERGQD